MSILADVFLALKMTCLEGDLAFLVVWFAPCELFTYHTQYLVVGLVGKQRSLVLSLDESFQQDIFGGLEIHIPKPESEVVMQGTWKAMASSGV